MTIAIPGLASSTKTPSVYLNVVLGGPGTSAGAAPQRILLIGNKIESALTGASPSFTVAAGSMPLATPTFCASAADALALCGNGSELHRMALAVFAQYPAANLFLAAAALGGGASAAAADLQFTTTSTGAFTVRVRSCGQTIDVGIPSGTSATNIADAVATAILEAGTLPFTAQYASGLVTFTAKEAGPRGNSIIIDASFVDAAGIETRISNTSPTSSGAGTTAQFGGVGSISGSSVYTLSGGATVDDISNVIAAIASTKYDRIVVANNDSTNIGRLNTHLESLAGVTIGKRQQGVAAFINTSANAITLSSAINAPRTQIVWHFASPLPGPEVAAQVAAARLAGDGSVGGGLVGENSDPASNLDGLQLASVLAQLAVADQPTGTEVESALNNGLAVLVPSSARPGFSALARSVTSRYIANNVPNYAVIDTSFVTTCDYVADDLQSALTITYQGFKLGADSANGNPPLAPRVTTPSLVRSFILDRLAGYEAAAILRDVNANASLLAVQADPLVPGRLNCEIPCEPVAGLHIIAGNVRQLASL